MIFVASGTSDGRELAAYLKAKGLGVIISVTSDYGSELAAESADEVVVERMERQDFERFFAARAVDAVVDASHPYAVNVSENIMQAAQNASIKYIRFEREKTALPVYEKLSFADSPEQAAALAAKLGEVIFLTTGSRSLPVFMRSNALAGKRVIARVLPELDSLEVCRKAGVLPKDIVAMQGPFTKELNAAMFSAYGAEVVITKDSGRTGGVDSKIEAAMELGLSIVVIPRPKLDYKNVTGDFERIYEYVRGEESGLY